MPTFTCQTVLFDLDGVLLDSVELSERLWCRFAAKYDVDAEQILAIHHGRRGSETVEIVAPHLRDVYETEELAWERGDDLTGLKAYDGAIDTVTGLPEDRWGIVTSGTYAITIKRMAHVGLPRPSVLVTADQVAQGKPHPEPYTTGVEQLATNADACVVFEDAVAGIASAKAAGLRVIAVASTSPAENLVTADAVVQRLAEVSIDVVATGLSISWM